MQYLFNYPLIFDTSQYLYPATKGGADFNIEDRFGVNRCFRLSPRAYNTYNLIHPRLMALQLNMMPDGPVVITHSSLN